MNFFQVPNFLWDRDDLDPYERAILIHIARKTVGWGKMKDAISYSQFVLHLGISKSKVIKTIKKLVDKKLIVKTMEKNARGDMNPNSYYFHPDVVEAANKEQGVVSDKHHVVSEKHNGSVQEIQPLSLRNTTVVSERDRQNTLIQNTYIQKKHTQHKKEKVCVSSENQEIEKWLNEKSIVAHYPYAYKAKIREALNNGEKEAVEEFEAWKKSKEQQEQAEQEEQQLQQVEHADFSIFVQNPQVLQHYINTDKEIKYVVDPGLSTLDIYFSDGQTAHIAKSQLYPILKELGGVA
ncbi:replication protein [Hydrogenimonas thermophila]|uniref:replication protein n=1 Tax=Hydrogenimonas thermophila TaxID=223786 RepID=UPI00293704A7|nr:replication protein [Hydrogenimonas thermophila]WOE70507.1 replication protein [Hydrogenimonas thermophila]WOE73023.1 replication protein [Hydrogenimonas thermophila]